MNKHFIIQWWHEQAPLIILYLLLVGLLGLLQYLYRSPADLTSDFVRFSLPVFAGWLTWSIIRDHHRQQEIAHHAPFKATTPAELALQRRLAEEQVQHRQLVQALRHRQHVRLDQLDLFSHEIKNALAVLQAQADNQSTIDRGQVQQSVRQANYYLDLLLNGERLTMTKTDFRLDWVVVSNMVDQVVRENAPLFINKQLRPHFGPLSGQVLTDPKWLHFCINQLLSNAIKYADPATSIQISWQGGTLKITNAGPAIPATDQPRLFEDGFTGQNGHQTTKSTGMGLYFVRQVARQLNFRVAVFSPTSRQTTAQLTFPDTMVKP